MIKREPFNCSMPDKQFNQYFKLEAKKSIYGNLSKLKLNLLEIWNEFKSFINFFIQHKQFFRKYKEKAEKSYYENLENLIYNLLKWWDNNYARDIMTEEELKMKIRELKIERIVA